MSTQTDIAELAACLAREVPDLGIVLIADFAVKLVRCEAALRRCYELECNDPPTTARTARIDRLEHQARGLVKALGLVPEINTDPRGSSIGMFLPSGRSNHMGGGTWRV